MVSGFLVFTCLVLIKRLCQLVNTVSFCSCRIFIALAVVLLLLWLVLDTSKRPEQLISFGGVCMFVVLLFLFSAHRAAVSFALTLIKGA